MYNNQPNTAPPGYPQPYGQPQQPGYGQPMQPGYGYPPQAGYPPHQGGYPQQQMMNNNTTVVMQGQPGVITGK